MSNTQEKVLYYLGNTEFLSQFVRGNCSRFFEGSEYKGYVDTLQKYFLRYKAAPKTESDFLAYLGQTKQAEVYLIWWVKYNKYYVSETYYVLIDILRKEYENQQFNQIISAFTPENPNTLEIALELRNLAESVDENSETHRYTLDESIKERHNWMETAKTRNAITTGIRQWDRYVGGLNKKELYLFYGRTGFGKSSLLFIFAHALVKQGYGGLFLSLEMPGEQILRMWDARESGVSRQEIKRGEVDPIYWQDYIDMQSSNKYPLAIADNAGQCDVAFIENEIRELRQRQSVDFVVIDHLSLMWDKGFKERNWLALGKIAEDLKKLAKKENIILITAAQANRKTLEAEEAGTEHIAGSDQIGANCDFVAFLSRNKTAKNVLKLKIIKNREGWIDHIMTFGIDWETLTITEEVGNETKEVF